MKSVSANPLQKYELEPPLVEVIPFDMETKRIIEALLFAAERPMTAHQLQQVFPELERPKSDEIETAIQAIIADYQDRPIQLQKVASGYRFQVREEMSPWVSRLFEEKPPKYSRALLETMAIIAYKQPVTRGDIEDIRGVTVSSTIIRTLLDREWIRVIAHKEVPGRPALYGSTRHFLDYFNLESLDELPTLQEIQEPDFLTETNSEPLQKDSEQTQTAKTTLQQTEESSAVH